MLDDKKSGYALGHSNQEYERLRKQAEVWNELTLRVLEKAGVTTGMICLDVGCGPGEAMVSMGNLVGPQGSVTGLDIDVSLQREALPKLQQRTQASLDLIELDVTDASAWPGAPYDVVFSRLLLHHLRDPIEAVSKMFAALRTGGLLVILDHEIPTADIQPRFSDCDLPSVVTAAVLRASGKDPAIGARLPYLLQDAGLPPPDGSEVGTVLCTEAGGRNQVGALVLRSVLPTALELGLIAQDRADAFFERFERQCRSERPPIVRLPLMTAVWVTKPLS